MVEQEDIRKDEQLPFLVLTGMVKKIDRSYAEGLLITYGSQRQHIWTYKCGAFDIHINMAYNCPCAVGGGYAPPSFVRTNYYCESGAVDVYNTSAYYFNDPLWDRSGCITSNCCDTPTQPWFYRELNGITTSDIEARLCNEGWAGGFIDRSALIDQFELYIH